MWFKKSKRQDPSYPFPGTPQSLDGHTAVFAVEKMASDVIAVNAMTDFVEITGPLANLQPSASDHYSCDRTIICREDKLAVLFAKASGHVLTGLRTVVMTSSLHGMHEALHVISGKRLAFVINLTCRAVRRHSESLHGGHDEYHGAAAAGFVQLFAANVQEAADFTLIAHRIAELSLTPVICAQDFYDTSHSIENVSLPEKDLITDYLGRSEDTISTPTPSQILLFGDQRRRIPVLVDRDHPAGIGSIQDRDSYFRAVAAQRAFFSGHCNALTSMAMNEYGELTGRFYDKVSGYLVDDADVLVLAQGAVFNELRAVVDYLRKQEKVRAGVVNMRMLRPFPGAQLTHMLKGKKAVTVLERTDQPLAEDLPLMREVRCAIDKAVENGRTDSHLQPYPDYDNYQKITDRPQLYSAIYGVGSGIPAGRDLLAVFRNMQAPDGGKKCFYLDVNFGPADRRFPYLQTLQQSLNKDYPYLHQLTVPANDAPSIIQDARAIQIHSLSGQGGLFAGNIFARSLANVLPWNVKTFPQGGLEQNMQPVTFTLLYNHGDMPLPGRPETFNTVLVSAYKLIENLSLFSSINNGGQLIVESNRSHEQMWHQLPRQIQQEIQSREISIFIIDAQGIAAATTSTPAFVDQLSIWALLGACLRVTAMLSTAETEIFNNHLREQLTQLFGEGHNLIDDITQTMDRAATELSVLPWQSWSADKSKVVPEPGSPWTAQQLEQWHSNVFDVTRFWHSVGFLYDSGQAEHALTDPYLATGILPAGSSAFRDITAYRLRIPEWLAENCTACGLCWAQCPESALPPAVFSPSSILHSTVAECEQQGNTFVQLKRIETQLGKQAYSLLAKDKGNQYTSMGLLLQDAFSKLIARMKIEGEKLEELEKEFELVRQPLEHFNIARTKTFFDVPHKQEKDSGLLLAISLNPMTCTGCGICVETCPDSAFGWTEQSTEQLDKYRHNWELQMKLPGISNDLIEKYITSPEPQSQLYRLLDKTSYHSMVGGDGSVPGNSAKTAVHLLTAVIESVKRPEFQDHTSYLADLIDRLEQKIQGKVAGTLNINDFESFSRRIARLEDKDVSMEQLFDMIDSDGEDHTIDQGQLQRLTGLLEKLKRQHHLYAQSAGGAGRARMLLNIDPAAATFWNYTYPYNPHINPWISHLPGDMPLLAEGIFEGVMRALEEEIRNCRQAELELNDEYDSSHHHAILNQFTWEDFNQQERHLIPAVLVLCQSGTADWGNLCRLLSSNYPIKIAMINSDGISVAPGKTGPMGEQARSLHSIMEKQINMLSLEHANTAIFQTTVGHPINLVESVVEALQHDGPALLHIYAPEPRSSGVAMAKIIEHAALACQSRVFPLFKIKRQLSDISLAIEANPETGSDWSTSEITIREPSGIKSSLVIPLTLAHWALGESRFQQHFKVLAKGYLNDQMKPLTEYISLDITEREGLEPYIDFTDKKQRHMLAIVSDSIVEATEETRDFWRYLRKQSIAEDKTVTDVKEKTAIRPVQEEMNAPIDATAYQQVTDRLLQLCGFTEDPDYFKQSLREFITQTDQHNEDK